MGILKIDFNKLEKNSWSAKEKKNVKLIGYFIQELMNNHNFEKVLEKFDNPHYVQHNRSIPDGVGGLVDYVRDFTRRFPEYSYDVKHIYADGDFVIFHSQITIKQKDRGNDARGINVIDKWKIKNNQIVEHWDSLQPMNWLMRFLFLLTGGKVANNNGVY